jgi:DNA-binding response OmpR family regulator
MNTNFKVLVSDDDPELLLLCATVLKRAGYEVFETNSGQACLNAAATYRPDLILLDVMLPDMSGTEVCKQIKSDPALAGTFVVLVSGIRVSSELQADGLNTGADGYIIKPISNKELLARVQAVERIKRAEDALRTKEKEQQKLISELQAAIAEIKTLKGFIPICASCKKIRDDEGFWNQLEIYISEHTDAKFSHGLCPDCYEKLKAEAGISR